MWYELALRPFKSLQFTTFKNFRPVFEKRRVKSRHCLLLFDILASIIFTWWMQKSHLSGVSQCKSLINQECHVHLVSAEISYIRSVIFTWWVQKSHSSGCRCQTSVNMTNNLESLEQSCLLMMKRGPLSSMIPHSTLGHNSIQSWWNYTSRETYLALTRLTLLVIKMSRGEFTEGSTKLIQAILPSELPWFSLQKIVISVYDTWPVANSKIATVVIQMVCKWSE